MVSLDALGRDLSCRSVAVNAPKKPVNLALTIFVDPPLTMKIMISFTINVPSSFALGDESATRAA